MNDAPIEIGLNLNITNDEIGFARSFSNRDDLNQWLKHEIDLISSITAGNRDQTNEAFSEVLRTLRKINTDEDEELVISTKINNAFSFGFRPSETEEGRFVHRIAKKISPTAASIAAQILTGKANTSGFNLNNRDANSGIAAAISFLSIGDPLGNSDAIRQAVTEAMSARKQAQKLERHVKKFVSGIEGEWKEKIEAYETKAALKAPTSYWEKRKEHHEKQATIARRDWSRSVSVFAFSFIILSIFVFSGALEKGPIADAIMAPFTKPIQVASAEKSTIGKPANEQATTASTLSAITAPTQPTPDALPMLAKLLQHGILLGTLLGLGIWVLRQKLRKMLSHEHLAEDAAERVTMVETFAALKNAGLAGGEFGPILNALYRPASTGLVSDDGPVTPLEIVVKEAVKKASGGKD
ncbi:hypothetical protein FBZ83_12361 [Azospirillum brasilense]|uniref:Uncharacterized protein n=1 Tax=Azospirillum brasilense TaxID=192 RepID=A0A560BSP2_AZOBR|nr:hypothetical protein [Azospirillum brasilense]TWA75634.1 hypothetical protein FBZ83_12361 [Azospirillum brasilense]